MGKSNKFSKDLMSVVFSNLIILISSIITGFVVPKVLGVREYGYYKIFTLYLSYSALMHLGFVDGVLLKFAGKEYDELPKEKFRRYTKFFFTFQCVVALIIVLVALFLLNDEYRKIIALLAIDILAINITAYYQYISQSTMRFTELSVRKILLAVLKIILVALMLLFSLADMKNFTNAFVYIGGIVLIDVSLAIWYFCSYKDISVGVSTSLKACRSDIITFFKEGIILTVAYQAAMVIFSLDRQFVSLLFDTETYGVYSFAYNIISMVTTVVSAVSFVLFPRLKQLKKETIMNSFSKAMASISIIAVAAMIGYQPLCLIIKMILPDYISALDYLRIIFPGLALSCCINIIMFTYYKAMDAHFVYFKICCLILLLAAGLNYIAYKIGGTPLHISIASIVSLLIWYLVSEYYFVKYYHIKWKQNLFYIIVFMFIFYLITSIVSNNLLSWILYVLCFLVGTIIIYKSLVIEFIEYFTRRKSL